MTTYSARSFDPGATEFEPPVALALPSDYPRRATAAPRDAGQPLHIPATTAEALRRLCVEEHEDTRTAPLALLCLLLQRYAGQDDITLGFAPGGRWLTVRATLAGEPTFRRLLAIVGRAWREAEERGEPARGTDAPRVQVALTTDGTPAPLESELLISLCEKDGTLEGSIEYSRELFEGATIRRTAGHLATLAAHAAAEPDRAAGDLEMLTDAERRQVLVGWNDTHRNYPLNSCLHEWCEAQASRTPEAIAVWFDGASLTYRELDRRSNQLAHHLRALGVGRGNLVGVAMRRSFEMIVSLLAVLKAGGAYVPIDPEYPRQRLEYMLSDSGVRVLLTQRALAELWADYSGKVLAVDAEWPLVATQSGECPESGVTPDDPAYMIYTSGSTGKPKGALNTHRAIANRLLWKQEAFDLRVSDRILQKTPFSFDVSVWEFFWPLMVGARIVVARPEGHRDPVYLVEMIKTHGITTIHFVPSMLELFLREPRAAECRGLKRVFCGGETLSIELAKRFYATLGAELHNLYGPTETAIDVTWFSCHPDTIDRGIPIGKPIANTSLYILDKKLRPVPAGVPGELHIGGVQVGPGYLNRPELTAERFIADPFAERPGARMYKTGDLCRWRGDGNIEFLGRLDHQVKVRGFRIELGEIEAALGQHENVAEAVVICRKDRPDDPRLVAYLVPRGNVVKSVALRAHLRERLPEYMVPSAFVWMEALPLLPSGKTDRAALPAPEVHRPAPSRISGVPVTPIEKALADIWAEVLGRNRVGVNEDFFELGGHSLLATRVIARVRRGLGVELPLRRVFETPTIAGLAQTVAEAMAAARPRA